MKKTMLYLLTAVIVLTVIVKCVSKDKASGAGESQTAGPITYYNASDDLIKPFLPSPGGTVILGPNNEFQVGGEARGNWFFEADFPVELRDQYGNELFVTYATAQGEWMTTEFVPYLSLLEVRNGYTGPATLVLHKDNPSGLPEHDAYISYPIHIQSQ